MAMPSIPPVPEIPQITQEQLDHLTKDQLATLLTKALEAQAMATRNMKTMNDLLAAADVKIRELESQKKSLEAENITLRNRP